jgi:hypothetical protein
MAPSRLMKAAGVARREFEPPEFESLAGKYQVAHDRQQVLYVLPGQKNVGCAHRARLGTDQGITAAI